jgi:hypothetical protein
VDQTDAGIVAAGCSLASRTPGHLLVLLVVPNTWPTEELMPDVQETWDRIEQAELTIDGVSPGTGFGRSEGLRIHKKIYAIQNGDTLILKLPRDRVEQLIESGAGRPWGPGTGRVMREWIEISEASWNEWPALTEEARTFVGPR